MMSALTYILVLYIITRLWLRFVTRLPDAWDDNANSDEG